jgi:hypothetical protein
MKLAILSFSVIAVGLSACGSTSSTPSPPVDGGHDASGFRDSAGANDSSPPGDGGSPAGDAGLARDSAFDCGATSCNGATSYCYAIVGGAQLPDAANSGPSWSCEPYDAGCGPSCACTPCGSMTTSAPGGCGCYLSPSDQATCLLCAP